VNLAYRQAILSYRPRWYYPMDDAVAHNHWESVARLKDGNTTTGGGDTTLQGTKVGRLGSAGISGTNTSKFFRANTSWDTTANPELTLLWWERVSTLVNQSAFTSDAGSNRIWAAVPWGDGNVYWDYGNAGAGRTTFTWKAHWTGKWVMVALTGNLTTGRSICFVNGEVVFDAVVTPSSVSLTNQTWINGINSWIGAIAEFAVFLKQLGRGDVKRLYQVAQNGSPRLRMAA